VVAVVGALKGMLQVPDTVNSGLHNCFIVLEAEFLEQGILLNGQYMSVGT
jgi:hypothetical protein